MPLLALPSTERRFHECPAEPDALAEAYVLGRLAPEAAATFDRHVEVCDKCAETLTATFLFIETFHLVDMRNGRLRRAS